MLSVAKPTHVALHVFECKDKVQLYKNKRF